MLLEKAVKGDRNAQYALYNKYCGKMLAVCMRYSKKKEDAEDILQEGFIKVFKSLNSFRGEVSVLHAWIKRIMINTALNYHRGKIHDHPMQDIEDMYDMAQEEVLLSNYHFNDLLALLQKLPAGCQAVFSLYALEGYAHKEIAEMLDISVGTSKSQYARAKALLRDMIQDAETINAHYEKQANGK